MKKNMIDFQCFEKMKEAYIYGTASSMQWLINELIQIRNEIVEGKVVCIELKDCNVLELNNLNNFCLFLSENFYELMDIIIDENDCK